MNEPDKIPETEEEIRAAVAWLKSQGLLPDKSLPPAEPVDIDLREFLALQRGDFEVLPRDASPPRKLNNTLGELDHMFGDELRGLMRAKTRRIHQENITWKIGVWSVILFVGGAILLLLLAVVH